MVADCGRGVTGGTCGRGRGSGDVDGCCDSSGGGGGGRSGCSRVNKCGYYG